MLDSTHIKINSEWIKELHVKKSNHRKVEIILLIWEHEIRL